MTFTGQLECRKCGRTGSCRDPLAGCLCGYEWVWARLEAQRHGYVRVCLGSFEPVYA